MITISGEFLLGFMLILFGFLAGITLGYCLFTVKE